MVEVEAQVLMDSNETDKEGVSAPSAEADDHGIKNEAKHSDAKLRSFGPEQEILSDKEELSD